LWVKVERLGLCTEEEEEEERCGVDQWAYAQRFELGKPGIAKAVAGGNFG
jgi:hypothetical protein